MPPGQGRVAPDGIAVPPRHDAVSPEPVPAPALDLPRHPEPLVMSSPLALGDDRTPLPRSRALARPGNGLLAAVLGWLRALDPSAALAWVPSPARVPLPVRSRRAAPAMTHRPIDPVDLHNTIRKLRRELAAQQEEVRYLRRELDRLRSVHPAGMLAR